MVGAPLPGADAGEPAVVRRTRRRASAASGSSSACRVGTGQSARRIVTSARIGIRIPSCGLISAATTAKTADRSGWSRHSSRSPSSRKTTPTESTWPQTTLSNQLIGLTTATNAAIERDASPAAELEDHRPDEPADGQVGEDRRHLDEGDADPADGLPDEPEHPQHVQVARACSRGRSRAGRSRSGPGWRGSPPRRGTRRDPRRSRIRGGGMR